MLIRRLSRGAPVAAAALSLAMAGCGRMPEPTPAEEPPPPPPPAAELMGPPPGAVQALPFEEPGPPIAEAPLEPLGPPAPSEPLAGAAELAPPPPPPPVVIAMAPIPNPPEPEPYRAPERRAERAQPRFEAPPAPPRRAASPAARPAPAPTRQAERTPPPVAARPATPPHAQARPSAPARDAQPAAPAAPASPLAERATRLAALETALSQLITKDARLTVPTLAPNVPATVTLTVPAGFSASLQQLARANDLTDAAASANLTAVLVGDGYVIVPDQPQARPVAADKPTVFEWTVTPRSGPRGPLRAEVGAQLLGAGDDKLQLGAIASRPGLSPISGRIVGFAVLGLIAAFVIWLVTGGRRPVRPAPARGRMA